MSSFERFVASSARKFGLEISRVSSVGTQLPVEATALNAACGAVAA